MDSYNFLLLRITVEKGLNFLHGPLDLLKYFCIAEVTNKVEIDVEALKSKILPTLTDKISILRLMSSGIMYLVSRRQATSEVGVTRTTQGMGTASGTRNPSSQNLQYHVYNHTSGKAGSRTRSARSRDNLIAPDTGYTRARNESEAFTYRDEGRRLAQGGGLDLHGPLDALDDYCNMNTLPSP